MPDPAPAAAHLATRLFEFPLLQALPPAAMAKLAAAARVKRFQAGDRVFRQGDDARAFYAILSGGARVVRLLPDGNERVLHRLRAGQTFAEAAVLSMPRYPATGIATATPTEMAEIPAKEFVALFEGDPAVAKAIVASLAGWLVHLVGRVEELTVLSADARLARHLLDLPSSQGVKGLEIKLPLAKKDLAAHLAITPETLSRVLRRWRDRGIVDVRGATVVVRDVAALLAISDEEPGLTADPSESH